MTKKSKYEIVYNDPAVVRWVSSMIEGGDDFDVNSPSIGILRDSLVVGGVVYTCYTQTSIVMNVAGKDKGWLTRSFLRAAFRYPFVQLGCRRVTGLVRTDNLDAQRFDEHLGFKREGLLREAEDDGCDLIVYGMLKRECRWLDI